MLGNVGKIEEYFGDRPGGLLYMEKMNSMLLKQRLQPLQHCFSLSVLYSFHMPQIMDNGANFLFIFSNDCRRKKKAKDAVSKIQL